MTFPSAVAVRAQSGMHLSEEKSRSHLVITIWPGNGHTAGLWTLLFSPMPLQKKRLLNRVYRIKNYVCIQGIKKTFIWLTLNRVQILSHRCRSEERRVGEEGAVRRSPAQ